MKITHFIRNFEVGGLETIVLRLAEKQVSKGHVVRVVCIEKEENPVLDYVGRGFDVVKIDKKGKVFALIRVLCELIFNRPDIINTHNFLSNVYGAYVAWLLRTPLVLTLHSGIAPEPFEFKRQSLFFPQHIVCVSDAIQSLLLDSCKGKVKTANTSVINNGIDPDEFGGKPLLNARNEFGISPDDIVVGTVGRLHSVNNQKILMEAIHALAHKFDNIRLLIVGDGPLRKELVHLSTSLGINDRVHMVGNRRDVYRLLSVMDIFVLPSLTEGSPISLIEAMSSRLPVIASDVGAIPKIINNGVNGFVIPPGDIDRLVKRIALLIEDKEKAFELGENAFQTIRKSHSMEKMYLSYQHIYENINHNEPISKSF